MSGAPAIRPGVPSCSPPPHQLQRHLAAWSLRWPLLPVEILHRLQRLFSVLAQTSPGAEAVDEAAADLLGQIDAAGYHSLESMCLHRLLRDDTHPCIRNWGRRQEPPDSLRRLLKADLRRLQQVARAPWVEWAVSAGAAWIAAEDTGARGSSTPGWAAAVPVAPGAEAVCSPRAAAADLIRRLRGSRDWAGELAALESFWRHYGVGVDQGIAAYRLIRTRSGPRLAPIAEFAGFPLEWLQLEGRRADLLERNTLALLDGCRAANALIWGPRGCGKSSLIRGLVTRYWERGLRAIEIPSASYDLLPALFGLVRHRHESFVAILDNIALEAQDPSHRTLASVLDGGLEQAPLNLAFYATSNYKDLIDRHGDRPGGPPPQHVVRAPAAGRTEPDWPVYDPQGPQRLDERRALDDRFALKIFVDLPHPSQIERLVAAYAERAGLPDTEAELIADFQVWRMRHNHDLAGGRTARDYVQHRVAMAAGRATGEMP